MSLYDIKRTINKTVPREITSHHLGEKLIISWNYNEPHRTVLYSMRALKPAANPQRRH
jgi:hypothetical protein